MSQGFGHSRLPQGATPEILADILRQAPSEKEREFETSLSGLLGEDDAKYAEALLKDTKQGEKVRYGALFALATYYRRHKDNTALHQLLSTHRKEFGDRGTFPHLYAMCLKQRARPGDLSDAIKNARDACALLPKHVGVMHNFAEAVVLACETGVALSDREGVIKEAEELLRRAIEQDHRYGKFYCTKGRLEALQNRFAEAEELIREAIDREDSTERDYALRLSEYQGHLLSVRLRQSTVRLQEQIDDGLRQVREIQAGVSRTIAEATGRQLELLGFFSAIVALTVGGLQMSQRQSVQEAVQVLLTLAAVLLIAFGGLGFLVQGSSSLARSTMVIGLGIALLAGAVLWWPMR